MILKIFIKCSCVFLNLNLKIFNFVYVHSIDKAKINVKFIFKTFQQTFIKNKEIIDQN